MENKRRDFLKLSGLTCLGIAGGGLKLFASVPDENHRPADLLPGLNTFSAMGSKDLNEENLSIIGLYGEWANSINRDKLPAFPSGGKNGQTWKHGGRLRKNGLLTVWLCRILVSVPKVNVIKQYAYDGLHIEELSWQLPYGRPTEAILLKPLNAKGRLPAILAFHDHGGNKYFGKRKITKTSEQQHPLMMAHQKEYYEGLAWANDIAKRGYVVLVSDAFSFASRRVMMQDVPDHIRHGLNDQ